MFKQPKMKQPMSISLALAVKAHTRGTEASEAQILRLESDQLKHSALRARETSQIHKADGADFYSNRNTSCKECCDIRQKKMLP